MKIVSTQMKCQMKVNLPGIEFLGTEPKLRIRKKNSLWCVYVLHKTSREKISRSSRAVMAKKCAKKCVVRAVVILHCSSDFLVVVVVVDAEAPLTPLATISTCKFSKLISIHFLKELVERI